MTIELNYFIDQPECEEATFEIYLEHYYFIKSITLKNISFYNSWWTGDFLPEGVKVFHFLTHERLKRKTEFMNAYEVCEAFFSANTENPKEETIRACAISEKNLYESKSEKDEGTFDYRFPFNRHFSLSDFCYEWETIIKKRAIRHVKFHCDNNNYIIIELTEDKDFLLTELFENRGLDILSDKLKDHPTAIDDAGQPIKMKTRTTIYDQITNHVVEVFNKWFGFKQETFDKKGKYYSTRPLPFYITNLFLRCDLHQNTLQNNQNSDILCSIPVKDGEQIKLQRFVPTAADYTRRVDKATNHLTFQITDKNGKLVNFRGCKLTFHFTLEIY